MFLGVTLYSHSASVSPQVYKYVLAKLMFGGTEGVCFHTNSLHKDSFCHIDKSELGIGQFIHELLREPLIYLIVPYRSLKCHCDEISHFFFPFFLTD